MALGLVALAIVVSAPPAMAGEVKLPPPDPSCVPDKYFSCGDRELTFTADPGEKNVLAVSASPDTMTVRDDGAPLRAGAGCQSESANQVSCSLQGVHPDAFFLYLYLGDANDSLRLSAGSARYISVDAGTGDDDVSVDEQPGAFTNIYGGSGDDVVVGGSAGDNLSGGAGNDDLSGGPGNDTLGGGAGTDRYSGGEGNDLLGARVLESFTQNVGPREPAAGELLDGGPGEDAAQYDRAGPVRVDLASGTAGEQGENDRLVSIESASGGDGDDVLIGDDGPNTLDGGCGRNVVSARAGDDHLLSSCGADRLNGGAGDDLFMVRDFRSPRPQRPDHIRCETGQDVVQQPDPVDRLALDCESVYFFYGLMPVRPVALSRRRVAFRVPCPTLGPLSQRQDNCRVRVKLTSGASTVAQRDVTIPSGRSTAVSLTPSPAGFRLIQRRGAVTVTVRGLSGNYGYRRRSGQTVVFRGPV